MSIAQESKPVHLKVVLELTNEDGDVYRTEFGDIEVGERLVLEDSDGVYHPSMCVIEEITEGEQEDFSRLELPHVHKKFVKISVVGRMHETDHPHGGLALYREIDVQAYHELDEIHVCTPNKAIWKCSCGKEGEANSKAKNVFKDAITRQARKNFNAHQKRAHAKHQKERDVGA